MDLTKFRSSFKSICFIILVFCMFNMTNEAKIKRTKTAEERTTTTTGSGADITDGGKPSRGGKGDIGGIPIRKIVEIKDLEGAYIEYLGNTTCNKTGLWPEAKKMEKLDKLADMCTRAHFLHGGAMYENIKYAKVTDGTLHFTKKNKGVLYDPIRINVVKYKSDVEDKYYYLARGMKATCVFYLKQLNNDSKTDYLLSEYIQEVPMPAP